MWRNWNPVDGGNVKQCCCCGKQYGIPQKLKIKLPYDLAVPLLHSGDISLSIKSRVLKRYLYIHVFIAAPFTIAKRWKLLKCLSMNEWGDKMCIHIMEYY